MDDAGLQRRRGKHGASASLIPFRPSVTAIRMSWQPRVFRSREDLHPELGAFGLLDPDPEDVARAVGQHGQREIDRLAADRRLVANLDAQRVEEHDRIHRLERPALPRRDLRDDASVTVLIRSGETSTAYISARNA